eukprot:scaffold269_cov404-Prasinococcus_capsulatus_cf.AAC.33
MEASIGSISDLVTRNSTQCNSLVHMADSLLQQFDFVGIMERFNESLQILAGLLNLTKLPEHQKPFASQWEKNSPKVMRQLQDRNLCSTELYRRYWFRMQQEIECRHAAGLATQLKAL